MLPGRLAAAGEPLHQAAGLAPVVVRQRDVAVRGVTAGVTREGARLRARPLARRGTTAACARQPTQLWRLHPHCGYYSEAA